MSWGALAAQYARRPSDAVVPFDASALPAALPQPKGVAIAPAEPSVGFSAMALRKVVKIALAQGGPPPPASAVDDEF